MQNGITSYEDCYPCKMDHDSQIVTFVELTGEGAAAVLAEYGRSVARTGTDCELLASETQTNMYLLICRGKALENVPDSAKHWSFRSIEVYP